MIDIGAIKKDTLASIIVFLVAMPLAIGISIACGLPIYCGIISGIIGGMHCQVIPYRSQVLRQG